MKIAIIGCGDVGTTLAHVILQHGYKDEVLLFNKTYDNALGCYIDLSHAAAYYDWISFTPYSLDNLKLCEKAKVIVIAAGAGLDPSNKFQDRNQLAIGNSKILIDLLEKLNNCKDSIFLIITNPVDNMTYIASKYLKQFSIPHRQIIGLGTTVESARYRSYIAKELNCNPTVLNKIAYVLGEHGEDMVAIKSRLIQNNIVDDIKKDLKDIEYFVKKAALFIRNTINSGPKYAIAQCAWDVINNILNIEPDNKKAFLTVSSYIEDNEYYGISDVCLSLPTKLNENGIEEIVEKIDEHDISEDEKKQIIYSSKKIKRNLEELRNLFEKQHKWYYQIASLIPEQISL